MTIYNLPAECPHCGKRKTIPIRWPDDQEFPASLTDVREVPCPRIIEIDTCLEGAFE